MLLLKDFKIQIAWKTWWKRVKLLTLSNFTFFHNVFLKPFSSMCLNEYIWRKGLKQSGLGHRSKKYFFFSLKLHVSTHAIVFYWRNDTYNLCHLTVFIAKSVLPLSFFVLWIVRSCLLVKYSCLLFLIINSLDWLPGQMPHQGFQRFDY